LNLNFKTTKLTSLTIKAYTLMMIQLIFETGQRTAVTQCIPVIDYSSLNEYFPT